MLSDLQRYVLLLKDKWPLLVPALLTALAAGATVVLGKKHPIVLSGPLWLTIAVVCLTVAQFLVWRDSEALPIDESHADQLRAIGSELQKANPADSWAEPVYTDGTTTLPVFETAFRAHFPKESELVEEWRRALGRANDAEEELDRAVEDGASKQFPSAQGWSPDSIASTCKNRRADLLADEQKGVDTYFKDDTAIRRSVGLAGNSWGGDVELVKPWVMEMFHSQSANRLRDAISDLNAARAKAVGALDGVTRVAGSVAHRERSCPVCSPP